MVAIVFDASAVLALIRDEPEAAAVRDHVGRAAISTVNLHEVVKDLLQSGLNETIIRQILGELRLDVHDHGEDDAYAGASLHAQTRTYGRGLGDRTCLALALKLGVPALTTDREWKKVKVAGLKIIALRA
ncbi:MAG: type II toxin-antitoxin system VapC family toxin [Sphingomonas sp.]|uniref:type II toxin-antitoxin system VapC family toxin n=1 Tax=Sphingomonas sp. TaxID=28214 RepID=UPI0035A8D8F4|nr:type II toxin-antitoxin system VapC family toxin [Sphingomonas sp.]